MSKGSRRAVIVGGGVIGIACAHWLERSGWRVTVFDRGVIGGGCSHGNCGYVSPSHVLPLAGPGAIRRTLLAMLQANGPFRIRPGFNLSLWSWLYQFARRCNERDMLASARAIQPLLISSLKLYEQLIDEEQLACEWERRGMLFVYRSQAALDSFAPTNQLLDEQFGEGARRLNGNELTELEPACLPGLAGAWYYEHDAHLRSDRLLATWRATLASRGVEFREHCVHERFDGKSSRAEVAKTSQGDVAGDLFILASGAWTPLLGRDLGCAIPIQPGKGYSITMPRPATCPTIPLLLPEQRVGVTPFSSGYRLGSMMEFVGYNESLARQRLELLTRAARLYLRDPVGEPIQERWFGWRPMTYDSVPIIDRTPAWSNVILATGHNMLGLSMATATGRLVAELANDQTPHIDARPYSVRRFG